MENGENFIMRQNKVGLKPCNGALHSFPGLWKILGMIVIISTLYGCIGKENTPDSDNPVQSIRDDNLSLEQNNAINSSVQTNKIRLILRPKELNRTGKLPITLIVMNPRLNETVLTIFKPEVGQEWYNQTNITYIVNNNWTQNFTVKPTTNISYIKMFVQISENNTVVRKTGWNISLPALFEKAN